MCCELQVSNAKHMLSYKATFHGRKKRYENVWKKLHTHLEVLVVLCLTLSPSLTNFLLSLNEKSLLLGPCAFAPPRQWGGRLCPARATPPPFWGRTFRPDPLISPILLV